MKARASACRPRGARRAAGEPRRRPPRNPGRTRQAHALRAWAARDHLEDVDAVLSDVSSLALDAVVDAAFAGSGRGSRDRHPSARRGGGAGLGTPGRGPASCPDAAVGPSLRRGGAVPSRASSRACGACHFRRRAALERHLERWTSDRLKTALGGSAGESSRQPPDGRSRRCDRRQDAAGPRARRKAVTVAKAYCVGGLQHRTEKWIHFSDRIRCFRNHLEHR